MLTDEKLKEIEARVDVDDRRGGGVRDERAGSRSPEDAVTRSVCVIVRATLT